MKLRNKVVLIALVSCLFTVWNYVPVYSADTQQSGQTTVNYDIKKYQKYYNAGYKILNDKKVTAALKFSGLRTLYKMDFSEAINKFDLAIKENPNSDEAYACKANALRYSQKNKEAKECAQKALEINSENPLANFILGSILSYNEGNPKEGLIYLDKSIAADPKNAAYYVNKAGSHNMLQQYDEALNAANKAISFDSSNNMAYRQRALTYYGQKSYTNAINDLNNLIKKNPKEQDYYYLRAKCYAETNNVSLAIADANKLVKLDPQNADSYLSRLDIYTAVKASPKMIEADIKSAEMYINQDENNLSRLLVYYYNSDKFADVKRIADKVLKINPKNEYALYYKGCANIEEGSYQNALDILTQYKNSSDKLYPTFYYFYGIAKLGVAGRNNKQLILSAIDDFTTSIEKRALIENSYLYRGSAKVIIGEYKSGYADLKKYCSMVETPAELAYQQMGYAEDAGSYEEIIYKNGQMESWRTPDWAYNDKSFEIIVNNEPNNISARLNYRNSGRDYYKKTIDLLYRTNVNIATIKYCRVPYSSTDVTSFLITSPYVNAIGDKAEKYSNKSLLFAMTYKNMIKATLLNNNTCNLLTKADINAFFDAVEDVPQREAVDMISEITNIRILDCSDDGDVVSLVCERAVRYLEDRGITTVSPLHKNIMKEGYSIYADVLISDGKIDESIWYYERASKYGLSMVDAYKHIVSKYIRQDDYFKAAQYCTKGLNIKPDPNLYYVRGVSRTKLNDYSGALSDFTKAITYKKDFYDAYWGRADIYFDRRQYPQAFADYKKYSLVNKKDPAVFYNMGVCLYNMNKNKEAYPYINKAKNLYQANGNKDGYDASVRLMNKINGYR